MKTIKSIKRRLKNVTRRQYSLLDKTISLHSCEDIILLNTRRYAYNVER
ncbi:hypothetical protein [Aquimarina sp. RZ0]|nr:hypothetical protein [Aquimarina sp. RZ0]